MVLQDHKLWPCLKSNKNWKFTRSIVNYIFSHFTSGLLSEYWIWPTSQSWLGVGSSLFLGDDCPIHPRKCPTVSADVAKTHNDSRTDGNCCWCPAGFLPLRCEDYYGTAKRLSPKGPSTTFWFLKRKRKKKSLDRCSCSEEIPEHLVQGCLRLGRDII